MISIETNALGRMISIDINFSFFLLETDPRNRALGLPLDAKTFTPFGLALLFVFVNYYYPVMG